jgi:hypothetical protein
MAKYMPRLFAEYFNRGVVRTYSYELADQGPDALEREQNFGLLRFDLSEKPAYTALKNLIDLVEEPDAEAFSPAALDFTLTGPTGSLRPVRHTLLQKSDGAFFLMLWKDVLSWNVSTQSDNAVLATEITVTLAESFRHAAVFHPNHDLAPIATYFNASEITVSLADEMIVLELSQVPEPAAPALASIAAIVTGLLGRTRTRGQ